MEKRTRRGSSAGFKLAVSQSSRPVGCEDVAWRQPPSSPCRSEISDTAGWKPALLGLRLCRAGARSSRVRWLGACLCISMLCACAAAPIRFGGVPVELTLSAVGERTVHLQLSSLDEQGRPRPVAPSTILVPFASEERLRLRELAGSHDVHVGQLRVTLRS